MSHKPSQPDLSHFDELFAFGGLECLPKVDQDQHRSYEHSQSDEEWPDHVFPRVWLVPIHPWDSEEEGEPDDAEKGGNGLGWIRGHIAPFRVGCALSHTGGFAAAQSTEYTRTPTNSQ